MPVYVAAGVKASVTIGAYAGAVSAEPDGALFGAICGIDPQVRLDDEKFLALAPLLQLLTMVLAAERIHLEL